MTERMTIAELQVDGEPVLHKWRSAVKSPLGR
jgi:hypothetical protein